MNGLGCVSVAGCRASLELLERLAFHRDELAARLPSLRAAAGAAGLAVLSTCQRVEVYATWAGPSRPAALVAALAADRGVPEPVVAAAATSYEGDAAARHLLRVAAGLESFVLGEVEVAGQVRAAAEAGRGADAALDRLLGTAISAARRAHRETGVAAAGGSVASAAVAAVAAARGGTLAGRRLLVVGAGEVARVVVDRGSALGAAVTVCNRTRRHADRFAAAGATVVDLAELPGCLAVADVAVLATAAPHPLVDADLVRTCRPVGSGPLTLVDLALPRNVEESVRALPAVRLVDLADLRAGGTVAAGALRAEVAAVEGIIETELARYRRWSAGRSVGPALRRLRGDAEEIGRQEIARAAADLPVENRPALERAVLRTARRFAHSATRELLAAAESGDTDRVALLAGLYRPSGGDRPSAAGDADAAAGILGPLLQRAPLDPQRAQLRAVEQAPYESGAHPADELAV